MKDLFADVPLATILALGGAVLAFVAYLNGDLSVFEALAAFGITTAGSGALGKARADSGKGVRR